MYNYQRSGPYRSYQVKKRRSRKPYVALVVLLIIGVYCAWAMLRPLPALQAGPVNQTLRYTAPASKLNWPVNTQSAVGIVGTDIVEASGQQIAKPMASTAKVVTALVLLDKYPLKPGEQGPTMTITPNDVAIYNRYVAQDGSVVPVTVGEKLTLYQMLQALMLPSANNISDSMAIWAYGSLQNYSQAANKYIKAHGLSSTKIGSDASGLAPDSVSTASDLVRIGKLAMANPVLSNIVGQSIATGIPSASTVRNVNFLLGTSNIIGLKTGNSDEAGGVFVSASRVMIDNKPTTIVTALVNTPNLFSAVQGSLPLIRSAQANFSIVTALRKGAVIAQYNQPWSDKLLVTLSQDLKYTVWNNGKQTAISTTKQPLSGITAAGTSVGNVKVPLEPFRAAISVPLQLEGSASEPSPLWRLMHPF